AAGASEESVGELDQDARAVALQRVRARRAAVGEVFQDGQALRDDRMRLLPLDVRDETEPARTPLPCRIIEALAARRPRRLRVQSCLHDRPRRCPKMAASGGKPGTPPQP